MKPAAAVLIFSFVASLLPAATPVEPFLGQWALFLPNGAGWLEVRQEAGYLDADLLWYGGSVVPVSDVYLDGETLVVTRVGSRTVKKEPKRELMRTEQFRFAFYGDQLVGEQIVPRGDGLGVDRMTFTARKLPPPPPAPDLSKVKFGKPIKLFNGVDLTGWKLIEENRANGWKVVDGVLVNDPVQQEGKPHVDYGNLRTVDEFEDFNLKIDVNVPAKSNSGIYLRGIYEVQVMDSYGLGLDSHHMGAIYSRITPTVSAEKPAGEWQSFDITLCDRHVTVILNGVKIIDNQPLYGVTGGALQACPFKPGPIYLQGDHGKVMYRNIILRPIIK
ncbi:MAG: DUF1080 domain-containing protein [candidate division KSB1 bacterium]|nr:DUF1080 domain-containing protein [candidate division KSB1 bacterium]MDZ7346685.1 DUF1080 domain-containing protein [candidate division KSB1 bacterium]